MWQCSALPVNLLAFYYFEGGEGGRREGEHVREVQIESEGLSFCLLAPRSPVWLPRGGIEMIQIFKSPVSDCRKLQEETQRNNILHFSFTFKCTICLFNPKIKQHVLPVELFINLDCFWCGFLIMTWIWSNGHRTCTGKMACGFQLSASVVFGWNCQ